jgi:hypothetical protein
MNNERLTPIPPPRFKPGRVFASCGAMALGVDLVPFLDRHFRGDWGDQLEFNDILANEQALDSGERLLSKYRVRPGVSIYIITEADRSLTTILLPEEY